MAEPGYETCLHRLPEPCPDDPGAPFVGNETRDDNLAEAVRVGLWNATGGDCRLITAEVFGGRVVLMGEVASEAVAQRCDAHVRAVAGIESVNNLLSWGAADR